MLRWFITYYHMITLLLVKKLTASEQSVESLLRDRRHAQDVICSGAQRRAQRGRRRVAYQRHHRGELLVGIARAQLAPPAVLIAFVQDCHQDSGPLSALAAGGL